MRKPLKAVAIITSVNPPGAYVDKYLSLSIPLIIVADRKTPRWPSHRLESPLIHFLSLEMQHDLFPQLTENIGHDTYARKNIGYLFAKRLGANLIIDTDDDTTPTRNPIEAVAANMTVREAESANFMWNPYSLFANHSRRAQRIWPRGYPLSLVEHSDESQFSITEITYDSTGADVYQFLISGNPDVDAIQRLVQKDFGIEARADYADELVKLGYRCWSPGNTQASIWNGSGSFEYLYIPSSVSMRFCDILRMYVAQSNLRILFGGFWFNQVRNFHSLSQDFQDEFELRSQTELLYNVMVRPNIRKLGLFETYSLLVKTGIASVNELKTLELFIEEIAS